MVQFNLEYIIRFTIGYTKNETIIFFGMFLFSFDFSMAIWKRVPLLFPSKIFGGSAPG